ncbi:MAG: hypothetical protein ACPLRU_08535 [Desulfofundulus sp.]|uniref:hypothetical protein n=1 Tax=Desulfofundulus sp. TaxID=2282750 RepID=UPI003C765391
MVNYRVTIILRLWEVPTLEKIRNADMVRPEDMRRLGDFLKERLERVASIMELLQERGFYCRGTRQAVILEGSNMEAYQVKELLQEHGVQPHEYEIKLEYTRQWGIM